MACACKNKPNTPIRTVTKTTSASANGRRMNNINRRVVKRDIR